MRLLNTATLAFEEFHNPPPYAILSHRWGASEVSYEEYGTTQRRDQLPHFAKILECCKTARERRHAYVWIDTCCIDKRSSAELSESINSMWNWYTTATECFAYLNDVEENEDRGECMAQLERSRWFSRGWTLQELLAPRIVTFFTKNWKVIGRKDDADLLHIITRRTTIPESCLRYQFVLFTKCLAQRLSWAARRTTSRLEDKAYCLLGLMGVNMPLIYGEGDKAFQRLQQEIVRQTDDESIFAWRFISPPRGLITGVLAADPSLFSQSGSVNVIKSPRPPYAVTNKGLDFRSTSQYIESVDVYIIPLNCEYTVERDKGGSAARVERCYMAVRFQDDSFYRVFASRLGEHMKAIGWGTPVENQQERTFYLRLLRWEHQYQPAISILTKAVVRFKTRKKHDDPVDALSLE